MKQEDTKQGNQQKMQKRPPHMSGNPAQPDVQQKQEYEQYVKSVTPTYNLWAQMGKAFLTGGIICCIGQGRPYCVLRQSSEEKVAYGALRQDIANILSMLCKRKGVNIVEAEICPDHVHMLVEIPPNISVASFVG